MKMPSPRKTKNSKPTHARLAYIPLLFQRLIKDRRIRARLYTAAWINRRLESHIAGASDHSTESLDGRRGLRATATVPGSNSGDPLRGRTCFAPTKDSTVRNRVPDPDAGHPESSRRETHSWSSKPEGSKRS